MSYSNIGHETNIRLSQNVKISLNTYKTKLGSNNILIVGATGEGKSRNWVRPFAYSMPMDTRQIKDKNGNLYNPKSSFVFTDPKGELFNDTAGIFKANGYDVKVLNLVNMGASDCYNPFKYIYYNDNPESALEILIDSVVNVAKGQNSNADPHWSDNAKNILNSIAYYVYYELPAKYQNFDTINQMIKLFKMSDDDVEAPIDKLFRTCQQFPLNDHPAIKWRNKVSARGGELSSIVSSADTALRLWTSDSIKNIMNVDNINLDTIGDKPTALYVITPVSNDTYNNIIATFYNQLFETLMYKAESVYNNKGLPHHVFVVQDEFANTGKIPSYDKKIATFRSCNISSVMIVQSSNQLKAMYDKEYQSIADNAHITIFLGNGGISIDSNDISAAGFISHALGKTTIRTEGQSLSYQNQNTAQIFDKPSLSTSINIQQRDLMTPEEVRQLPSDECIVLIKGEYPIRDKKTNLDTCLNYGSDLYTNLVDGKDGDGKPIKFRALKNAFKSDIRFDKNTLNNYKLGLNNCELIDNMGKENLYNKIIVSSNYNSINKENESIFINKDKMLWASDLAEYIEQYIDELVNRLQKNFKLFKIDVSEKHINDYLSNKVKKEEEIDSDEMPTELISNRDSATEKKETIDDNLVNKEIVKTKLKLSKSTTDDINSTLKEKTEEISNLYEKFKNNELSTKEMKEYLNNMVKLDVSKYDIEQKNIVNQNTYNAANITTTDEKNEKINNYNESIENKKIKNKFVEETDDYIPDED